MRLVALFTADDAQRQLFQYPFYVEILTSFAFLATLPGLFFDPILTSSIYIPYFLRCWSFHFRLDRISAMRVDFGKLCKYDVIPEANII